MADVIGEAQETALDRAPPGPSAGDPPPRTNRIPGPTHTAEALPVADDPPLKDRDVAELLGVSPRTVRRWRSRGLLAFDKIGGTVRVRRSDLERALRPAPDDGRPDPAGSDDASGA